MRFLISCNINEFLEVPLKSKYPTVMLNKPHITLIVGVESPCPGGSANGVGKGLPEIPFTKWGTAFARNIPAKYAAT
jgi:hypothetical protein